MKSIILVEFHIEIGLKKIDWTEFVRRGLGFISGCEIYAVLYGTEATIIKYEETEKGELEIIVLEGLKLVIRCLDSKND